MPNRADRNHAIERLLREAHASASGPAEGPCVAAEELAAWLDGGLPQVESTKVEAHLASCSECQALLSLYAASEPVAGRPRAWTRSALPFAAAAVVVIGVWLAGPRGGDETSPAPAAERQMARLEETPARPAAPPVPASAEPARPTRRRDDQPAAPTRSAPTALVAPPSEPKFADSVRANESAAQERQLATAAPAESRAAAQPLPAAPAAANVAEADLARVRPEATPPPPRARTEAVASGAAQLAAAQMAKAADARVPIASPDGMSRWRVVGTTLEMSADGGTTWLPATGATPAELADVIGGASPARGVSWLVGRGGLVLVTSDGRRFTRATAPAAAVLTGVQAVDGAVAEVRASDGRAWRTTNTGRTWTQLR